MDIAFLIVSIILIIGAVCLFLRNSSGNHRMTKGQKILAIFQIVLCGSFFVLCLSDVLDIKVSFSAVRVFLNIFYSLAFLSLSAFALSNLRIKKRVHMQIIVSTCAALIAVQCFIFPYGSASEVKRICEAVEGIIVFTLLVLMIPRISDEKYSQKALWIIIALESAVAVLNTVLPMPSVTEDIQSSDIPMNYLALYMRPVILSSLALVHHVWLDLQKTDDSGIYGRAPKDVKKG